MNLATSQFGKSRYPDLDMFRNEWRSRNPCSDVIPKKIISTVAMFNVVFLFVCFVSSRFQVDQESRERKVESGQVGKLE